MWNSTASSLPRHDSISTTITVQYLRCYEAGAGAPLVAAWAAARGVQTSILRLQNVYGPGQSPINPYTGITTLFIKLASAGEVIPVYEDGQIIRDFVFIDDVVQSLGLAADAPGNILADVGSGTGASIECMAHLCAELFSAPEPQLTGQFHPGGHAQRALRYGALGLGAGGNRVGLAEGLRTLGEWITTSTRPPG